MRGLVGEQVVLRRERQLRERHDARASPSRARWNGVARQHRRPASAVSRSSIRRGRTPSARRPGGGGRCAYPPSAGAAMTVARCARVEQREHRVGGVRLRLVAEVDPRDHAVRAGRARTARRPGAAPAAPPSGAGHRPGLARDDLPAPSASSGSGRSRGSRARRGPRGSSGWSKRPSGSACQVSTSASGTGSPAPSSTRPRTAIAPGVPGGTTNGPSSHGSPSEKNGPTVCDGVVPRSPVVLVGRRRARAAQHDVPAVGERPLRLGRAEVEARRPSARAPPGRAPS